MSISPSPLFETPEYTCLSPSIARSVAIPFTSVSPVLFGQVLQHSLSR